MRAILAILGALSAIPMSGCTLIHPASDHRGGEIPLERFCAELADLSCRARLDCCSTATETYEDCVAATESECTTGLEPIGSDPRAGYSPDAAARALATGRALAAGCDTGIADWVAARDGLQGALTGTVVPGEVCVRTLGDLSAATLLSCEGATYACRSEPNFPWRCGPRGAVNAECYIDFDCVPEAYCSGVLLGAGQCLPRRADGDVCTENKHCQSLICQDGLCAERTVDNTYCSIDPAATM